jgi:hypothetical protein
MHTKYIGAIIIVTWHEIHDDMFVNKWVGSKIHIET